MSHKTKAALLSVSDTTGLEPFAKFLSSAGYVLLVTTGTGAFLRSKGIECESIESYTGQKEILGGRVKTLHPKIHAGILARRDNPTDLKELQEIGAYPIDVVVVTLYPFLSHLKSGKSLDEMVELIDIGGATLLRAAAKNFKSVLVVSDPADYPQIENVHRGIDNVKELSQEIKQNAAKKVFKQLAADNAAVSSYLDGSKALTEFPDFILRAIEKSQPLRYGENPHQKASLYRDATRPRSIWNQLQGKELSYNNILDFDSTLGMLRDMSKWDGRPSCVIVKHLNPCGLATAKTLKEALLRAKRSDPRSHFGGIIGCTSVVTKDVAEEVVKDFSEILIAPDYDPGALDVLSNSKNLRVVKVDLDELASELEGYVELRSVVGGFLIQERDTGSSSIKSATVVSRRKPTEKELIDLSFAWTVCTHVKSNAIVIAKDEMLIGMGSGQVSRIDSVDLAISKAKTHEHEVEGAVAASDAFFPFPDSIISLAGAGVKAIIAPSGAKRDGEAIEAADKYGMSLLFAEDRHFRH